MVLAAACCQCCCSAAASTTSALVFSSLVTFRTGVYANSRASYVLPYVSCIMQSPAPASSLEEPPPAASPQLGLWICQQGLRSARIRGLLLVPAAASAAAAASTTTALAFLRLVTFRTGMIKFLRGIQCLRTYSSIPRTYTYVGYYNMLPFV